MKLKDWFIYFRYKAVTVYTLVFIFPTLILGGYKNPMFWPTLIAIILEVSAGFLLNDARDYPKDMLNPRKAHKPLMRGLLTIDTNYRISNIELAVGAIIVIGVAMLDLRLGAILAACMAFPVGYYYFKETPPLDLFIDGFSLPTIFATGWVVSTKTFMPLWLYISFGALFSIIHILGADVDQKVNERTTYTVLASKGALPIKLLYAVLYLIFAIPMLINHIFISPILMALGLVVYPYAKNYVPMKYASVVGLIAVIIFVGEISIWMLTHYASIFVDIDILVSPLMSLIAQ